MLAAGETAPAHVDDIVDESYDSVYQELLDEKLATWTSTGAIPDKLALHVSTLVVAESADEFGVPEPRIQRLLLQAERAMKNIRRRQSTKYVPNHSVANYF